MADNLEQQINALQTQAMQCYEQGDNEQALALAQEVHDLSRNLPDPEHPLVAVSLSILSLLHARRGAYDVALPLCERALAIQERVLGPNHPDTATSLDTLAHLHERIEADDAALPLCERALAIREQVLGPDHPDTATSLNNLARLHGRRGAYDAALPLYERALAIQERVLGPDHPNTATSLHNLAVLYSAKARPHDALSLMEQALAINALMLGQIFSIGSEQQRMTFLQTQQGSFHAFLSLVWQHFRQDAEVVQRTFDVALRRKALGAEALFAQREAILGGAYPALEPQLHQLHVVRMQIAQKTLAGPDPEGLSVHQERLAQWHTEKEYLEATLARAIPEMNLERRLRAVDRQVVAWALPDTTTLVEFVRFSVCNFQAVPARGESQWQEPRYLAFVLPAGEPDNVQMIDLGEALPIDQMIATYRAHLIAAGGYDRSPGTSPSPGEDIGTALRSALFDPVARALPDGCTSLLLAPDGALSQLPFEVLPTEGGGYLTDTVHITYLSAGRDVLRFEADTLIAPTAPLIAADPDFDLAGHVPVSAAASSSERASVRHSRDLRRGGHQYKRLPGTAVEGERIATLLGVTPWLADRVMETPLKACRSPRILHLATHGGFLPDQPFDPEVQQGRLGGPGRENPMLRSFLVTAGVNACSQGRAIPEEAEDGILTAEDVSGMNLLGTELVVLSACDTGRGEVEIGEGVLGLRRAFVVAGAQTLVMSLWSASDIATAILMGKFYTHLLHGHGRDQALRHAQDELRRLTMGELRADWLTPEMILRLLAAGDPGVEFYLDELAARPDEHRPFEHPYFWGAFICQGVPAPLGSS